MAGLTRPQELARTLRDGSRGASIPSVMRGLRWNLMGHCVPAGAPAPGSRRELTVELPTEYDATDAHWFMRSIVRGFEALATVERVAIPQRGLGIVIGRARIGQGAGAGSLSFAIDFFDESRIDADVAAEVDLYFKLQYDRAGYGLAHVVPGGYVQPRQEPYDQFCRLRPWGREHPGDRVYGRFGTQYGEGPRRRAVELLEGRPALGYRGGLGVVGYVQSLQEAAAAAVCVDLPGRGAFCYRLVDYLAVGACVVAAPHPNRLPVELEDRVNIVYTREDMADLPDLCEELLGDEAERRRIGDAAAGYFDRHLHYLPFAERYLAMIGERLRAPGAAQ
jgi:hypothetical protein